MARARQLARDFGEHNPMNKAFAVAIVAAAMAEAGDVPGALAWAAGLEGHPLVKVGALIGIAAGQLQPLHSLGDVPQAALKRLFPRP